MQMCFELAKKALGKTSPNPYVGAVLVHNNKVLATGYHRKAGDDHAELDAIKKLSTIPKGTTLYCNLEPCCHENKRTPPCAQRIIEEKINKVVISNLDPNPAVAGQGVKLMREAGIEVTVGIMKEEGALLNEVFFTHITKKRPFIHLKWAQTLDGKLACLSGDSKWITSEIARRYVHRERFLYDGVLVGAGTVRADNPKLTVRLSDDEICKKRIILTYSGVLGQELNLFNDKFSQQTLILSARPIKGRSSIHCPAINERLDLNCALEILYSNGIKSLYVEGGGSLIQGLLDANLVDRVSVYTAPKVLGHGRQIRPARIRTTMKDALTFSQAKWTQLGPDMLMESTRNICLQD